MSGLKVLVAGGAGFLGSHLIDRLLTRPEIARLVVVDNLWTGRRDNLAHIADPRLYFVTQDVESFQSDQRFDEIYHLASPASPAWYMTSPSRTISANVVGAMRLLELLATHGRFCFTSTSEVYGDPLISPQSEDYFGNVDCTGPRAAYDESKRCTEALLSEHQRLHGLNLRIARVFNAYGPRMRADDGRALPNFLQQALAGQSLTVYGDGRQTRSWGYVDDIADGLAQLFGARSTTYPGPINIGSDIEIPVMAIADYVASLVPGSRIEHTAAAPGDPSNRRPDLARAKQIMPGWACHVGYRDGIRRMMDWAATAWQIPSTSSTNLKKERPAEC